jgi:CRISPR-associated protein Csb3
MEPRPNITIPVDLTNPGQFFACCGLLELADRLWPGAEGWFEATKAESEYCPVWHRNRKCPSLSVH